MVRVPEQKVQKLIVSLASQFNLSDHVMNSIGSFAEQSEDNFEAVEALASKLEVDSSSAETEFKQLTGYPF